MNPTKHRKFKLACATLALAALAGCSGEVLVTEASGASGGGGECVPDPTAGLPAIVLQNPTSGAFIGGTLHFTVSVDDPPAYQLVVRRDEDHPVEAIRRGRPRRGLARRRRRARWSGVAEVRERLFGGHDLGPPAGRADETRRAAHHGTPAQPGCLAARPSAPLA